MYVCTYKTVVTEKCTCRQQSYWEANRTTCITQINGCPYGVSFTDLRHDDLQSLPHPLQHALLVYKVTTGSGASGWASARRNPMHRFHALLVTSLAALIIATLPKQQ